MKNKKNDFAERVLKLPPYLFIEIDKMKNKAIADGVDIVNLGVGDPDIPTPEIIINRLKTAIEEPENHQYPLGKGKLGFREEIMRFMKKRFNVIADAQTQIYPLIGSKEGLGHFPLAFINKGDVVIVPEPAYPVYNSGTIFAGGEPYFIPLKEENRFLPELKSIPFKILNRAKIIFLNYPNNPTGAMATREFFKEAIEIADKYNIIIVHDSAYSEMYFNDKPLSILEIDSGFERSIEFHSLSKPFSMTGWRIGWAVGNEELVNGLASIKDNLDSGVFGAIQDAGITALVNYELLADASRAVYEKRASFFYERLKELGWNLEMPYATFYIWCKPPGNITSQEAVKLLINKAGIICAPGSGFGPSGEGFVRFALTKDISRLDEAIRRIKKIQWTI